MNKIENLLFYCTTKVNNYKWSLVTVLFMNIGSEGWFMKADYAPVVRIISRVVQSLH